MTGRGPRESHLYAAFRHESDLSALSGDTSRVRQSGDKARSSAGVRAALTTQF